MAKNLNQFEGVKNEELEVRREKIVSEQKKLQERKEIMFDAALAYEEMTTTLSKEAFKSPELELVAIDKELKELGQKYEAIVAELKQREIEEQTRLYQPGAGEYVPGKGVVGKPKAEKLTAEKENSILSEKDFKKLENIRYAIEIAAPELEMTGKIAKHPALDVLNNYLDELYQENPLKFLAAKDYLRQKYPKYKEIIDTLRG
jgi:hypothetical protein